MVRLVRHRRTKGPTTDRPYLNHRATSRLHKLLRARSPIVVSEARAGKAGAQARCVPALSIQRLEGSRPWLQWTRALCKFNGRKERCRGAPRLCCSAPYMTLCSKRSAKTKEYLEERG